MSAGVNRRGLIKFALCYPVLGGLGRVFASQTDSSADIKCADVNALRNLSSVKEGQIIYLAEYSNGSGKGGGTFKVDLADKQSPDDGGYCFINSSGERIKRVVAGNKIRASDYGMDGKPGDNTMAFKDFLKCKLDKIIDVSIFTGGMARLADDTRLSASDGAVIYATSDVNHDPERSQNNQGQTLEVGNNCDIDGVIINGGGFRNNGFLIEKKTNVTVKNCRISNGKGQAILDYMSKNCVYAGNSISTSYHGIQLWLSKNIKINENQISQVKGGIWSACAQNVYAAKNLIHDCSDVGLDWEGGNNCISDGNTIKFCTNGELAVFATGPELKRFNIPMGNLTHKNNIVVRAGDYLNRAGTKKINYLKDVGACMIYGNLDPHLIGPIIFENNNITAQNSLNKSMRCFASRASNKSDAVIIFKNNKFESFSNDMGMLNGLNKVVFTDNKFIYHSDKYNVNSTLFQNFNSLSMTSNEINVLSAGNRNSAIFTINSGHGSSDEVEMQKNTFTGFSAYAFVVTGRNLTRQPVIKDNVFNPNLKNRSLFSVKNSQLKSDNKYFLVIKDGFY
ncbi:right-handed parallel beta-helix repeat-containing protein [Rahnella aquatilis]|uniref:right-handed parallel beta-helix repeat-containing protein n=1 Tax=Rahnella aquatilis TaxID=34038 RepID=UPI0006462EE1|nr:right-handed parallel beta-helix repeat-containing protein [Rahnella aquatilis]